MKFLKFIAILLILAGAAYLGYTYFLNPAHQHEASVNWISDEANHWHVCTAEGCEEILDKAAHVYDDNNDATCNVCDAERDVNATYPITVTGGTADKTEAVRGETITLTANEAGENQVFSHWTVNGVKLEGNTFEMPGNAVVIQAVFVDTVVTLDTPDNTGGLLFNVLSTKEIQIDRQSGNTMFDEGVDYILIHVYTDAEGTNEVGQFILSVDPTVEPTPNVVGYVSTIDGSIKKDIVCGGKTNAWIYASNYYEFFSLVQSVVGYEYASGRSYYFGLQAIASEETFVKYGIEYTYVDSAISITAGNAIVEDASAASTVHGVKVLNGLIDGQYTELNVGYGYKITLSADPVEGYSFGGWYVADENGQATGDVISASMSFTYTVSGDVTLIPVFSQETIKLPTYDNSESKAIYNNNYQAIEIDRVGTTMFGTGVSDVMFYVYTSPDAAKDAYVGRFIMSGEYDGAPTAAIVTCFRDLDGNEYRIIYGGDGNYWAHDYSTFFSMLQHILGYDYSDGQTYYFAVQLLAEEGTVYRDSDISAIGADGFARDASKGTEKYTITVENGTIDGSLTTITAGYGVNIKLSAIMPEGKEFGYWTYVIYNEDGSETLGTIVSSDSDAVYTVTSSIILRAVEKPADRIKLDAPTNANNEMFKVSGAITEYDRQKNEDGTAKTAFVDGVGRVRFYMYADVTIDGVTERVIVSWFDIDKEGYMYDYNGNKTMGGNGGKCLGIAGDFYGSDGNWHNFIKASFNQGADAQGLGITWVDTTFYVACQSISDNPLYENSDIGAMGQGWVNI